MAYLSDLLAKGATQVQCRSDGHEVIVQEVGPVGYDVYVDGQCIAHTDAKVDLRHRALAHGIDLGNGQVLKVPDTFDGWVQAEPPTN